MASNGVKVGGLLVFFGITLYLNLYLFTSFLFCTLPQFFYHLLLIESEWFLEYVKEFQYTPKNTKYNKGDGYENEENEKERNGKAEYYITFP